jgi:hypothetical protein
MSKTIRDLIEDLKRLDEVTLLEVLGLTSEDILDRFEDIVESKFDQLADDFETEEEDDLFDGRD